MSDLRFAFRLLGRQPGFTAVAVLTIAIAIGANTTLFSVMNAVVLRPLDFPQPESIVRLWASNPGRNLDAPAVSWPKWEHYSTQQQVFSELAISVFNGATVTGEGEPEQVPTLNASATLLLRQALYEVQPFDPTVFALVATFFATLATFACLTPARRATRIDPMTALRME